MLVRIVADELQKQRLGGGFTIWGRMLRGLPSSGLLSLRNGWIAATNDINGNHVGK